jgi:hypothetical protein
MPFDRQQPHNVLPLLPPAMELETKAVLKQVNCCPHRVG